MICFNNHESVTHVPIMRGVRDSHAAAAATQTPTKIKPKIFYQRVLGPESWRAMNVLMIYCQMMRNLALQTIPRGEYRGL